MYKGEEEMMAARSTSRQRLLDVAKELFYQEGIRAIGVDTIVQKSGVGKSTLYRHFRTKDDLIAAYLKEEDRLHGIWFEEVTAPYEGSPKAQLLAWFESCTLRISYPGFRGCPFLNALAEFSDVDHPARRYAVEHERSLQAQLYRLCQQVGARDPEELVDQLLLVINGALSSASIFGSTSPALQLTTVAMHLIDLHLESTQAKS
jgi:AcrR family transcriptional regulator